MADNTTTTDTAKDPEGPVPTDETALRERVAKLEEQNDEFLRHLAEFQNRNNEMLQVMRRKDQELEGRLKYAHEKFALDLVTALDNLDRAVDAAKKVGEKGPLTVGVAATQAQILEVLKRHGITPIEALGQPFDPNKHQAIQTRPAGDGHPANTIAQVVQQGFMIHDRVLRPAAVIVAQ
jgi:molecular chaperone GrpE